MLDEQKSLIYKHFVDLVQNCDLEKVMRNLSLKDPAVNRIIDNVKFDDDRRHNNRCILFELLKSESATVFPRLVSTLRAHKYEDLADLLENKKPRRHRSGPRPPPGKLLEIADEATLKIEVKYATKFCDTDQYSYKTRSKNRGQVLIINNILFDTDRHTTRTGAEVDDSNLKDVFEKMGIGVEMYRNLTKKEIESVTEKFARRKYEKDPDIGIVIIMSHGERVDNKIVVVGSDGKGVDEEWIIRQFSNKDCQLFRNKPKILVFNICRGDLQDSLVLPSNITECDSACTKAPENTDDDERFYSDLMICHPCVKGFQAHRDTVRGCWYIELMCKVFMEHSCEIDVESMFKMVERGLKNRISERMTRQTSTITNIAFRSCYFNPGIYEEGGLVKPFQ